MKDFTDRIDLDQHPAGRRRSQSWHRLMEEERAETEPQSTMMLRRRNFLLGVSHFTVILVLSTVSDRTAYLNRVFNDMCVV